MRYAYNNDDFAESNSLTYDEWHSCVITRENSTGTFTIYIDGIKGESNVFSSGVVPSTHNLTIGHGWDYNNVEATPYYGKIALYRVFNRQLTDSEALIMSEFDDPSNKTPPPNILTTTEPIKDNDKLVLVKDDDSIHELTANGVTSNAETTDDFSGSSYDSSMFIGTGEVLPYTSNGNIVFEGSGEEGDYKFSNLEVKNLPDDNYGIETIIESIVIDEQNVEAGLNVLSSDSSEYFRLVIVNDEAICENKINGNLIVTHEGSVSLPAKLRIEKRSGVYKGFLNDIEVGTTSDFNTGIKANLFGNMYGDPLSFHAEASIFTLYNYNPTYEMDTTSITNGEIPSKAYRVDESVAFNGTISSITSNAYSFVDPLLKTNRIFGDTLIDDSVIETRVNMSATGNKMIELKGDIYRES
jgi:hypothetical protein